MIKNGVAQYGISLVGGPDDGQRKVVPSYLMSWPLPRMLSHRGGDGYYRKTRQSKLPDDESFLMRGAEYEWVGFADLLDNETIE